MKKSRFNSPTFYWAIVSVLTALLLWNLYLTIAQSNLAGFLPIVIQGILLILIFRRNEYAKTGIKFWAIFFLIIGSGLQFSGRLIKDLTNNFSNADLQSYVTAGITILIGIAIVRYANKTIEIVEVMEEEANTNQT